MNRNWSFLRICPDSLAQSPWLERQQLGFDENTCRDQHIRLPLTSAVNYIYQPPVNDLGDAGNLGEAPAPTPGRPDVQTVCPAVHVAEQAPPDVVMQAAVVIEAPPPTSHLRVTVIVVSSAIEGVGTLTVPETSDNFASGKSSCENHSFFECFQSS